MAAGDGIPGVARVGEVWERIRSMDWSPTPLGEPAGWSPILRTGLDICIHSRTPIAIIWGPEKTTLYNDAFVPLLGSKHPWALGASADQIWAEAWHVAGWMLDRTIHGGESTFAENLMLPFHRHGFTEEAYFTFSCAPVHDEDGRVGGAFVAASETTGTVLGARRLALLEDLGARVMPGTGAEDTCVRAARALARVAADVPFALVYLADTNRYHARLVASTGLPEGSSALLPVIPLSPARQASGWPLGLASRAAITVDDLRLRFGSIVAEPWPEPIRRAVVLPLRGASEPSPLGYLVLGLSPRLIFDSRYAEFFGLVADHVTAAIESARALETQLRRAESLSEIDQAKTRFFANVSHEIRTPLTLMMGPLTEAISSPDRALSGADLDLVHRNSLHLLKLVNTILDFSRIEAGRMAPRFRPTHLAMLTTEIASTFRQAMERSGICLELACDPTPEPVPVDRDMWETIVLNLLSNALNFTFEGTVRVGLRTEGDEVTLEVADTGVGIPPEEIPHVFDRFHRGTATGTRARTHAGTGIGLALVHELVDLHGGRVAVKSEVGRGTTFFVTIPRRRPDEDLDPADTVGIADPIPDADIHSSAYLVASLPWPEGAGGGSSERRDSDRPRDARADAVDVRPREHRDGERRQRSGPRGGAGDESVGGRRETRSTTSIPDPAADGPGTGAMDPAGASPRHGEPEAGRGSGVRPTDASLAGTFAAGSRATGLDGAREDPPPAVEIDDRAHREVDGVTGGEPAGRAAGAASGAGVVRAARSLADRSTAGSPREPARVLVVDDNADMRDFVGRLLRTRWAVDTTDNGADALAAIRKDPPDLVVADVMMPGLDGFELIRALRGESATAHIPVLLLSAHAGEESVADGLRAGADDYLVKPFAAPTLLARVEKLIVERRSREAARVWTESERARLEMMFNDSPAAALVVRGPEFILDFANRIALSVWRKTPEIVGRPLAEAIPELDTRENTDLLRGVLTTGKPAHFRNAVTRIDLHGNGILTDAYFDYSFVPLHEPDGTITSVFIHAFDVTDLVAERRAAETANRMKDEFLATVSHELRAPLNAILGWTSLLRSSESPDLRDRALATIDRSVRTQVRLIEDILDVERIASGKLRLDISRVNVAAMIEAAIDIVRPAADEKHVRIEVALQDGIGWIDGDADRLQQVVCNLLGNSVKFTPDGGTILLRARRAGDRLTIRVSDNGVGIPAQHLPHVFERFRQGPEVSSGREGGLGIGLELVRSLVEMHGGTVSAQSHEGEGTMFTVVIPTGQAGIRAERLTEARGKV